MKIAFLTPEYPHPKLGPAGGIGTGIMNLCAGLLALGHQPVVIIYGQPADTFFEEGGIRFHTLKNVRFKGLSWLLTRKKIQKLINKLHAGGEIDIVEAPDWTGISAFVKSRCPMVIRLNGSDTYFCHLDGRPVNWFNKFLEKRALENADALVSVSAFTAEVTNRVFKLRRHFEIIPNSIEVSRFAPVNVQPSEQTVLYFGTLIRKKGLLELPHIFNRVIERNPQATLILAGRDAADIATKNPSTWSLMKPLFTPQALEATKYIGPLDYASVSALISRASVCVFPTFAEALPLSWLEAMAMQKAVVACNIGWATEIVEDGISGLLAHPRDHGLFAGQISKLLEDEALRETMGIRARQRVLERFGNAIVARQTVEFYSKLI